MVEELSTAVSWLHRTAASFGGCPKKVSLIGHSAGAQLCLMTLLHLVRGSKQSPALRSHIPQKCCGWILKSIFFSHQSQKSLVSKMYIIKQCTITRGLSICQAVSAQFLHLMSSSMADRAAWGVWGQVGVKVGLAQLARRQSRSI